MDGLQKLGFLGSGYLLVLALLPGQVQWIESTAGITLAKWIGEPRRALRALTLKHDCRD